MGWIKLYLLMILKYHLLRLRKMDQVLILNDIEL